MDIKDDSIDIKGKIIDNTNELNGDYFNENSITSENIIDLCDVYLIKNIKRLNADFHDFFRIKRN